MLRAAKALLIAFEIAMAKVCPNSLVILLATAASLALVVQMALKVPFAGSVVMWFAGVVLCLFFATALGIFLGPISRSMVQFALLIIDCCPDAPLPAGARPSRANPSGCSTSRTFCLHGTSSASRRSSSTAAAAWAPSGGSS